MLSHTIREKFLQYFKKHEHVILPSSPVVPLDDPTLLFNNAGMNQFKDIFLGRSKATYQRVTTAQKCIRVGGKHNDLENVGHTSRHLTFFEMLGNFSFGDYFKEEAIAFAWEVATEVFSLDPEKIWVSVFREDSEAYEMWQAYVPKNRIAKLGEKDNFWMMGDTGPCGPCSELYYDRGDRYGKAKTLQEDVAIDGERFIEFWNLVFMQFNRSIDGTMHSLPNPCVDTGSGLERLIALKMGVDTLFETDILRALIGKAEDLFKCSYDPKDKEKAPAFHVIADHLRTLAFSIADGVQPGNVDRGYVLRKVLRRAVRYAKLLNRNTPFLAEMIPTLVGAMGQHYGELALNQERIQEIVTIEEEAFFKTLRRGGMLLQNVIDKARSNPDKTILGEDAFTLKDTYGLPIEEILLVGRDTGLHVDLTGFEKLEHEAKERSKQAHKKVHQIAEESVYKEFVEREGSVEFVGYDEHFVQTQIIACLMDGVFCDEIPEGAKGFVILKKTPFYAEMGGQVGDIGHITTKTSFVRVEDTHMPYAGVVVHSVYVEMGTCRVGDKATATIDEKRRQKIANSHTATHLLHWALMEVLGAHIKQAGSLVQPERLRFDFSHHKALSNAEIDQIEDLINAKIRENRAIEVYEKAFAEVQKSSDIKQFFGEKYGDVVRVVDIDYSKELCGGTHTNRTGNIGYFRVVKESSIAAGVRRIEAVCGGLAEEFARDSDKVIQQIASFVKAAPTNVLSRVEALQTELRSSLAEIERLHVDAEKALKDQLLQGKENLCTIDCVIADVSIEMKRMRDFSQRLIDALPNGIIVLIAQEDEKSQILVRVSSSLQERFSAKDIINELAPLISGRGGGKRDMAQAGGGPLADIESVREKTKTYIKNAC